MSTATGPSVMEIPTSPRQSRGMRMATTLRSPPQVAQDKRRTQNSWARYANSTGEPLRSQVNVPAEAVDQRSPAAAHNEVQSATSDRGRECQCHEEQRQLRYRSSGLRASEHDQDVRRYRRGQSQFLDRNRQRIAKKLYLANVLSTLFSLVTSPLS